jgi:hypothetical protein
LEEDVILPPFDGGGDPGLKTSDCVVMNLNENRNSVENPNESHISVANPSENRSSNKHCDGEKKG